MKMGCHWNRPKLLTFYGEGTVNTSAACCWMRKSRDSDGSLDLNGLLLCGMPVATIHSLNRQKVNKFIQEN
jgi:hypothetical protein